MLLLVVFYVFRTHYRTNMILDTSRTSGGRVQAAAYTRWVLQSRTNNRKSIEAGVTSNHSLLSSLHSSLIPSLGLFDRAVVTGLVQ